MKTLSIRQPWASLIAEGYKTMELRTWENDYRGPLAIHASKKFEKMTCQILKELFPKIPFDKLNYPQGEIIARCELVDIISLRNPVYEELAAKHLCPLSHFYHVHYGWVLSNIKPLPTPIPCKGQLGLFEVEV